MAVASINKIMDDPYAWLAESKSRLNRKIIGCFPMFVPHELVHAAGMLPVDLLGASGEMTAAAEYLQTTTCYPVRGALELLLTGRLSFLDGAVYSTVCTGATAEGAMIATLGSVPFYHQLVIPRRSGGEAALDFLVFQLRRLNAALEGLAGRQIDNRSLQASIELYDRSRALLSRAHRVSRDNPGALPAADFAAWRAASCFMPRDEFASALGDAIEQLERKPACGPSDPVRLLMAGGLCDLPQRDFLALVEDSGAVVAADDTFLGERLWAPTPKDADPVVALARRYFEAPPCPTQCDKTLEPNFDYLLNLAKSAGCQGAIFVRPLYCDVAGIDYPSLTRRLQNAGVPTLSLDIDGREPISGQVRTRVEAFVEMLRR